MKCKLVHESFKYIYGIQGTEYETVQSISEGCYGMKDTITFQVLMSIDEPSVLCVDDQPAFHKRGRTDQYRVAVNKGTVKIIQTIPDDDGRLKADIISEQKYQLYESDELVNLWVEVETDTEDQVVEVFIYKNNGFEDEVLLEVLQFKGKVYQVEMPQSKEYKFYLDLWQHNSNIARKYDVELWSEAHFNIIEAYIESLSVLGQKSVSVIVSEIPWSGQNSTKDPIGSSDLFEYSMIQISKDHHGFSYDFSALDQYILLCEKYGIKDEIEVFGLMNIWTRSESGFGNVLVDYDDGVRLRYYDESTKTFKYIKHQSDYLNYVKEIEAHFEALGIIDKVRVIADEPSDLKRYLNRIETVHQVAPKLKFKAAIDKIEFMKKEIPNLTDYCPILTHIFDDMSQFREMRKYCEGTLSYYVCCHPEKPNTFIKSPLLESRAIPYIAAYLDIDGFLRWNYTVWPEKPLESLSCSYPIWPTGDTNFVYPGKHGKPLLSLRYKNLLRGIKDFELIKRYGQNISLDEFSSVENIPTEAMYYEALKKKILEEGVKLK